jgi:hypothetical protein
MCTCLEETKGKEVEGKVRGGLSLQVMLEEFGPGMTSLDILQESFQLLCLE